MKTSVIPRTPKDAGTAWGTAVTPSTVTPLISKQPPTAMSSGLRHVARGSGDSDPTATLPLRQHLEPCTQRLQGDAMLARLSLRCSSSDVVR